MDLRVSHQIRRKEYTQMPSAAKSDAKLPCSVAMGYRDKIEAKWNLLVVVKSTSGDLDKRGQRN